MPRVFKVLIVDSDKFFAAGLKMSIHWYFARIKMPYFIRETKHSYPMADLIFWAPHATGAALPPALLYNSAYSSKLVVVMTQQDCQINQQYLSSRFYRHQKQEDLFRIIDEAINAKYSEERKIPESVLTEKLTLRQVQILHYLSKGMYIKEIARILNIECKTVSSHKRAAMAKLRITKNTDLYQWFIMDLMTRSG